MRTSAEIGNDSGMDDSRMGETWANRASALRVSETEASAGMWQSFVRWRSPLLTTGKSFR